MLAVHGWTAPPKFPEKPAPFVTQLAIGGDDALHGPNGTKLGAIKVVAAWKRLGVDEREVAVDGAARRGTVAKPNQLWMLSIPPCMPAENRLGKQRFTPKRD